MHRDEAANDGLGAITGTGPGRAELARELQRLLELAVQAVPSCLGVSVTLQGDGPALTISARRPGWHDRPVLASLLVRLPRRPATCTAGGADLVVYASAAHAFRETAPSVLALLDMTGRQVTLDRHLIAPDVIAERAALALWLDEKTSIDRAMGMLLARGLLPTDGRRELERRASVAGISIGAAARLLLAENTAPADDA